MKTLLCFMVLFPVSCLAQDAADENGAAESKAAEPNSRKAFDWLKQFEGKWATQFSGTMESRTIGNRWLVSEITFPSGEFSVQTLGYDETKKRFVGTWVDATSNHIWHYTGTHQKNGKVIVLEASGPDMTNPKVMRDYRDIYEFNSEDEIAAVSEMKSEDGTWKAFSKSTMKRIK